MLKPRILLLIFLLLFSIAWLFSSGLWERTKTSGVAGKSYHRLTGNDTIKKILQKAAEAKLFLSQKGYNDAIYLLADMSLPSGQNRLFVYDLKKDSIRNSGIVTHGRCNQYWLEGRKYGNKVGSACTSLGKYKVGNSYYGRFGLAWKLHGLEKTNDKSFERFIVLHSHECVPEAEVRDEICQSDGCPTVSAGFLQYLQPVLNESKKPVLFWVYE
ncbi:MAG: murein L,D-transpeptidase catalytic domain-containing protein [Chitinophagaceae bacterium]